MTPCRIAIVDDHRIFSTVLSKYIDANPNFEVAGLAADGAMGLELCQRENPEMAVLDIKIPKMDGLELAKTLIQKNPDIKILMLTGIKDPAVISRVRQIGALGFVDKSEPFEILEAALNQVSQGNVYFSKSFLEAERTHHLDPNGYTKLLSPKQIKILGAVANGKSNKLIAEELGLSVRTVESHRYRMVQILGLENPKKLFRYAIDHGIGKIPS